LGCRQPLTRKSVQCGELMQATTKDQLLIAPYPYPAAGDL
jgi:hypothetical protein